MQFFKLYLAIVDETTELSLHKICQNTGFLLPVLSRIRTTLQH